MGAAVRESGGGKRCADIIGGRGCGCGRSGLGIATDRSFSSAGSSVAGFCSFVKPFTRATTTKMIAQIRPSMLASFTVLTGRAGFADVFTRDRLTHPRVRLDVLHAIVIHHAEPTATERFRHG